MSKHTPGPWDACIGLKGGFWITSWDELMRPIVRTCDPDGKIGPIDSEEDAMLISAAPDLLDALVHLLGYTEQMESLVYAEGTPGMNETVSAAIDAIAKARGQADE